MGEELLSLKWNNHQAHFVDILTFLREQEIFIDATLACGGKLYPAHKFVLSTCSEYFKQMFTKNPSKHPIVFLKDVTCKDLEALLDFMYNGEVNVPQSSLGSLIKTAEGLQIKGLAVPDDPPTANKRDQRLAKENRELTLKRDRSFSPPASKRLRETRRSPLRNSSASILSNSSTSDKHKFSCSSSNLINVSTGLSNLETLVDENSRTSAHSGLSEASQPVNAKPNTNNHDDSASLSDNVNEPSPGPSGMHKSLQSKEEEEMEIKQEDMGLVELGEEDDWRDGEDNLDDRSRDSSLPSVNVSNYADGLIPPSENSGDRAMFLGCQISRVTRLDPSSQDDLNLWVPSAEDELTNRFSYRQERLKEQIAAAEIEIITAKELLKNPLLLGNDYAEAVENLDVILQKKENLAKELNKLISGQQRQRKFRAKKKQLRFLNDNCNDKRWYY